MMDVLGTLTFANFSPPWFWLALLIVALGLLAIAYRGIYRRSGRKLAWTLFAMRAAGVVLLLLALVKPMWQRVSEQTRKPTVAVVLDDSQSMSLSQPDTTTKAPTPRYAQAVRWLHDSPAGRALAQRFDIKLFDIMGHAIADDAPPTTPGVEQTDLVRALRSVARQMRGQRAAGVLLISDGRDTTGRRDDLGLSDFPLPTYALGFRPPPIQAGGPVDVAVKSVQAPARALIHNTVPVKVLLSKDGGAATTIPLTLERAGTTLLTQQVTLPKGRIEKLVTLNYTPNEAGDFVVAARANGPSGDRVRDNNVKLFQLRVDAQPIRVLYIEGTLRPEYTFLHERLAHDPDVDLISFARTANPNQASSEGVLLDSGLLSAERLKKIDVVLLGDFEATMLQSQAYTALRHWVDQGGGLMVLAGYRNLSSHGLVNTPLADVLPVKLSTSGSGQLGQPFHLSLTEAGKRSSIFALTGDAQRDARMWESLPELSGLVATSGPKPGATVLARDPNPSADGGPGYVVLATQPFGKGLCALLTADTTWRWSRIARLTGRPDTLYVRFWSQTIRYLAQRDATQQRHVLSIATDDASYKRGERVRITVHENPAAMLPEQAGAAKPVLRLSVRRPDGQVSDVPVTPNPGDPTAWSASFFPDRGGRFEIAAQLTQAGEKGSRTLANQTTEFMVEGSALEMDHATPDPASLQQIARQTGGLYADLNEAQATQRLIDALPAQPQVTQRTQTAELWDSPVLFVLFLALVVGEWVLRRKKQLV